MTRGMVCRTHCCLRLVIANPTSACITANTRISKNVRIQAAEQDLVAGLLVDKVVLGHRCPFGFDLNVTWGGEGGKREEGGGLRSWTDRSRARCGFFNRVYSTRHKTEFNEKDGLIKPLCSWAWWGEYTPRHVQREINGYATHKKRRRARRGDAPITTCPLALLAAPTYSCNSALDGDTLKVNVSNCSVCANHHQIETQSYTLRHTDTVTDTGTVTDTDTLEHLKIE